VVGYQASWSGDVHQLPFARLTHINYSFALPRQDGGLHDVENPGKLADLVSLGHAAGVKVLIAVGGWNDGNDSAFETIAVDPGLRQTFVTNLINFAADYDLDGVDIDWEYPDDGASGEGFTALMAELSAQLHGSGKLLTAAVTGSSWGASGVSTEVFGYVDWLNLMAYDGGSGADHSPYSYAESALAYWVGRGLPSDKATIGVPFYSRPGWRTYRSLVDQNPDAPYNDYLDGEWYNGIDTIQAKTRFALDNAGGVMIWELSQDTSDDTSLLKAIDDEVHAP